jgi:hypothetical protein
MSAFILNMTCARLLGGVSDHAGNAAFAAAIASSTSAVVHCGAAAITSPVDGLKQSMYLPVFDVRHSLFIQYFSLFGLLAM